MKPSSRGLTGSINVRGHSTMPLPATSPAGDSVRSLHLSDFDLRFDRYRLIQPKADLLMARSLAKYSQLAPVVYCQLEGSLVLGIASNLQLGRAANRLMRAKSHRSSLASDERASRPKPRWNRMIGPAIPTRFAVSHSLSWRLGNSFEGKKTSLSLGIAAWGKRI